MAVMSRRSFLKLTGTTAAAVAGTALLSGCSVASYMQIQFDENVVNLSASMFVDNFSDELIKVLDAMNFQTKEEKFNAVVRFINGCLRFVPLFGVTVLSENDARARINRALDDYGTKFASATTVETIKELLRELKIKTDANGNIPATGNGYSTITVTFVLPL